MKTTAKITAMLLVLALVGPSFAGQIVAWGRNDYGECDVSAGDDCVAIAGGFVHGIALKSDGSIVEWGSPGSISWLRQVGDVPEGNDFKAISSTHAHRLALKSDGSLAAWGYNSHGQCDVPDGNNFVAIAAGRYHSIAIKSDGSLAAWGYNYYGQCNVPAGNDFVAIAAGFGQSLAIKSDGSLVAWGSDHFDLNIVPKGNDFIAVASGFTHNLALRSDGSLVAWGYNYSGQCNVPSGNDFIAVAANNDYCIALRFDGSLAAWGYNSSGQCDVPSGNSFTAIAAGYAYASALTSAPSRLVEIEIVGPGQVGESYYAQYKAVAYYEDGSTRNATNPAMWWVEPEAIATIESGLLQTKGVGQLQYITIYTTYTEGEVTVESEMTIQVYPSRTFYVPTDYETIQAAIDAARDVDRVLVADGTYTGPGNRDIDFLGKAITVRSESGPENCIIDCNGTEDDPHRGFHFHNKEDENSILTGFTIINGYTSNGSGIYCDDSSPTITNCNIIGNSVVGNGDNTGFGGGIYSYYSSPTIANCTISGNSAEWSGGGINCQNSSNATITNCTITSNTARTGGGICSYLNNLTITNCIFWGNEAPDGPELYLAEDSNALVNYTDVQGGQNDVYIDQDCTLNWGPGNINFDPCFVNPGYWDTNYFWVDGDYHLLRTSPCVDAASDANVYTDIEGNVRPFDFPGVDNNGELPEFDMGAYEIVPVEAAMKLTPQMLNCNSKGNCIKAHLTLPEGFLPEDVDVNESAVAEPIGIESEYIKVLGAGTSLVRLEIAFDRQAFCEAITETGEVEVTVIGSLTTSRYFYATDTIKIKP